MFRDVMLAHNYSRKGAAFPLYIEPKFDGARMITIIDPSGGVKCYSRRGIEKPAIADVVRDLGNIEGWVFDGEWYADSWSSTMTAFSGSTASPEFALAKYYIFDCLPLWAYEKGSWPRTTLTERKAMLQQILDVLDSPRLVYVDHEVALSDEDVQRIFKAALAKGYEGVIAKSPSVNYQLKRVAGWMKLKLTVEVKGTILRLEEGSGKHTGRMGSIRVDLNGEEVGVGTGFSDAEREILWAHKGKLTGKEIVFTCQGDPKQVSAARFPRADDGWIVRTVKAFT